MSNDKDKILQTNWQFLKQEVLSRWKRLTEADVENAQRNLQALNKLVEKEYGSSVDFQAQIQDIYEKCQEKHFVKNTKPVDAGRRDNSPERKLNENFSRTNSPDEVANGTTDSPTIHESGRTIH